MIVEQVIHFIKAKETPFVIETIIIDDGAGIKCHFQMQFTLYLLPLDYFFLKHNQFTCVTCFILQLGDLILENTFWPEGILSDFKYASNWNVLSLKYS